MIRLQCVGLYSSDFSGGTRLGDAQIIDDGKNYEVIDGYCEKGADRLITVLKERKIKSPNLYITHPHWDHYDGIRRIIRDSWFKPKRLYTPNPDTYEDLTNEIRGNKRVLRDIISEAKAKGIPVTYLKNEQVVKHGEIKFTVYQNTTYKYDGSSEGYVNDRSLSFWFYEMLYLTTGDAGMWCVNKYGLKPKFIKCGHHGNNIGDEPTAKPSVMAVKLKKGGCLFYWDNDYSTKLTDFLMTGREDAINAGMTIFNIHGDINAIWQRGYCSIYKDYKVKRYKCSYKGETTLKQPNLAVVMGVLRGDYGSDNARISKLIDAGFYPISVQEKVNEIVRLVKG